MQTKYRMDRDTRTLILKYIRKYDGYCVWYQAERDSIFSASPKFPDGLPRPRGIKDNVLDRTVRLEALEQHPRTRVIRAIDRARELIGIDYDNDALREKLKDAIWLSCLDGRAYPFGAFDGLVGCGRTEFYSRKNRFLLDIKSRLEI